MLSLGKHNMMLVVFAAILAIHIGCRQSTVMTAFSEQQCQKPQQPDTITRQRLQQYQQQLQHPIERMKNLSSNSSSTPGTLLRAIIHMGEAKAASSHIQSVLKSLSPALNESKYNVVLHSFREFKTGLMKNYQLRGGAVLHAIQHAKQTRTNIIYSSEMLFDLNTEELQRMFDAFQGFEITIVVVYRESVSRSISSFNQIVKKYRVVSLDQILSKDIIHGGYSINKRIARIFDEQLKPLIADLLIIDLYGVAAAGRDVAQVLLCDIAGAASIDLCNTPDAQQTIAVVSEVVARTSAAAVTTTSSANHNNESCDWNAVLIVLEIIHYAISVLRCVGNLDVTNSHVGVHQHYAQVLQQMLPRTPHYQQQSLREYLVAAKQSDSSLRAQYGAHILFGNECANDAVREQLRYDVINRTALLGDPFWLQWLHEEALKLNEQRHVSSCKNLTPP